MTHKIYEDMYIQIRDSSDQHPTDWWVYII